MVEEGSTREVKGYEGKRATRMRTSCSYPDHLQQFMRFLLCQDCMSAAVIRKLPDLRAAGCAVEDRLW